MSTPRSGGSAPIAGGSPAPAPAPPAPPSSSAPTVGHGAPAASGGAVAVTPQDGERRRRRAPLAWLPWALLAALLLLLALALLLGTLAGAQRATAPGAGAAASPGTLQVGSTDVLADPDAAADLGALQGQTAVGRGMLVESVVADEGFWVGSSEQDRVFVYLTPQARQSAGESGFQVEAGQRIDVNGRVVPLSEGDAATEGVTADEGADQLADQKAYVQALQVRRAAS